MNLKKYTRSDCKYRTPGEPTIRISKTGFISINKSAAKSINLKSGDKIVILQDEIRPTDWYIEKSNNPDAFVLRNSSSNLVLNASVIANLILKSLSLEKSTTFRMASEPTDEKYYAIITKIQKP